MRRAAAAAGGARRPRPTAERHPDPAAAGRLDGVDRFVLYFGKLLRQKGVHTLLDAWGEIAPRHPGHHLVVVGFGSDREQLEALPRGRVVFTGAMDHEQLRCLIPLAECVVVPSVLPEAFGMVAAEAAACGVIPVVADHSGLAEVAEGLGEAARSPSRPAMPRTLARRLDELLGMPAEERAALGRTGRERVAERWSWGRVARRLLADALPQST